MATPFPMGCRVCELLAVFLIERRSRPRGHSNYHRSFTAHCRPRSTLVADFACGVVLLDEPEHMVCLNGFHYSYSASLSILKEPHSFAYWT